MRNNLLILFLLMMTQVVSAQKLTVESMQSTNDLSASTQRRLDINKKPCALVKVQLPSLGAVFEGNIIKPTAYKTNEYWVYMTEGSKELHIKHPNYETLGVNFPDYGINGVQPLTTYNLTLLMPQTGSLVQTQKMTINYSPANAMVVVDSEPHQGNGQLVFNLPVGTHEYQIMAIGYETAEGAVKLTAGQPRAITEHLVAKKQSVNQVAQVIRKEQTDTSDEDPEIIGKTPKQIHNLGNSYYFGNNEKTKDYAKAIKYYRISAERGNTDAMVDIGFMYTNGQGVEKNDADAVRWYQKAAEQGNAMGQRNLGLRYINEKDYAEALRWDMKAAEQGNTDAMVDIGYMYAMGYGVKKDYAEANKWYKKAAELGNVTAQYNLGQNYSFGQGVGIDLHQAKYWYEKAAAKGHANAKKRLEELK